MAREGPGMDNAYRANALLARMSQEQPPEFLESLTLLWFCPVEVLLSDELQVRHHEILSFDPFAILQCVCVW